MVSTHVHQDIVVSSARNPPMRSITDLTLSEFQRIWGRDQPIVVTGVEHKLQGQWTPDYFARIYGSEKVTLVDCETELTQPSTVGDFFENFDLVGKGAQILKLKVRSVILLA